MATSKNKQTVLEFIDGLKHEDSKRVRATLTDDAIWWLPASTAKALGFPDAIRGADEIIAFNERLLQSTYTKDDKKEFVIKHVMEEGDMVAAVFTLKTVTPAGKPYTNEYIYLSRMRGGKIAEEWTYTDTAHAYEELVPKK